MFVTCARFDYMDICLLLVHDLMNGIYLPLVHFLITIWICLLFVHVLGTDYINAICAHYAIVCVCFVHALLIFLFMSHSLTILLIHSNTFMFTFKYFCLIYVSVVLANYRHKSHLILGLNRSRVSGEIPTCLPLVFNSIPYPVGFLGT